MNTISSAHGIRLPDSRIFSDVAGEQQHQQQSRQEAGQEDADDRCVGGNRVDDHRDRGRYQDAQRAGGRQRADRQFLVVAAALEFGQRDLGDGRAGRGRRARDRSEHAAADDRRVHQPAGNPVQPGAQAFEHFLAELGPEQDLAHPDEQRQRRQFPARVAFPERREQVLRRQGVGEEGLADPADDRQRHRDPHATGEQQQHDGEQQRAHQKCFSHRSFAQTSLEKSPAACRASMARW
jgi:hypothetical protein